MYRIPERWLEYSRCGEVIGDTGILASKTPLKKGFHKCDERPEGIPPSEEFTPTQLVDYCKKKGQRIGLVVDLTFSYRYYDPKELKALGVEHAKIPCPGQEIPDEEIYANFADVLENHLALDDAGMIVVHCTHGVNRTGYLVCKFLVDHFMYTADDAIKAFNVARGHSMERENYISDVHDYWKYIQDGGSRTGTSTKDSWEPWRQSYDHYQPYGRHAHSHRYHDHFYPHPHHYDPYRGYDPQWHHGYTDFCSKPNSYTRSRGRSSFRHRGSRHRHDRSVSGQNTQSPPRNQFPPKHQHFSMDQPPPRHQYSPVDQPPTRPPPPRNQPVSKQHFARDQFPHRNQPPPKNEHFSTDQPPLMDDLPKTPPGDNKPLPKKQNPPKAHPPSPKEPSPLIDQPTPKLQHPSKDHPPPRRSLRRRGRGRKH